MFTKFVACSGYFNFNSTTYAVRQMNHGKHVVYTHDNIIDEGKFATCQTIDSLDRWINSSSKLNNITIRE